MAKDDRTQEKCNTMRDPNVHNFTPIWSRLVETNLRTHKKSKPGNERSITYRRHALSRVITSAFITNWIGYAECGNASLVISGTVIYTQKQQIKAAREENLH